jgi:hypothetical protein
MDLFKASSQWSTRPEDERFWTVYDMQNACEDYAHQAAESTLPFESIRLEADGKELMVAGKTESRARLTHFAFDQVCGLVGAPGEYLRKLPVTLAAQNLNHGFKARQENKANKNDALLLFHRNGNLLLRAMTTEKYSRIWNYEVAMKLMPFIEAGWQVPPARPAIIGSSRTRPATEADVLRNHGHEISIRVGDPIAPAGLYASDHDMFAFLVDENHRVSDGTEEGLARGFFIENSEVGAGALKLTCFLYRYVCGNHIVWNASNLKSISIPHLGRSFRIWDKLLGNLRRYSERAASEDESGIARAKRVEIADTREKVVADLYSKRITSMKNLETAYDLADSNPVDGSPRSVWGMVQGMSRLSQSTPFADKRTEMDRAAGKIMQIAF